MDVPSSGFHYFLNTSSVKFEQYFHISAIWNAAGKGFDVDVDTRRLSFAHALWKNKVNRWKTDLDGASSPAHKEMSHLKLAGALTWALNKTQPVQNLWELGAARRSALESKGVPCADAIGSNSLLSRYPNEALIFAMVYLVFCDTELRRGESKRIDFQNPPLTSHFLRNFCFLLREESPGPLNIYMIFKAWDLYGLELAH